MEHSNHEEDTNALLVGTDGLMAEIVCWQSVNPNHRANQCFPLMQWDLCGPQCLNMCCKTAMVERQTWTLGQRQVPSMPSPCAGHASGVAPIIYQGRGQFRLGNSSLAILVFMIVSKFPPKYSFGHLVPSMVRAWLFVYIVLDFAASPL